ncbi:MAG: hypothetical protein H0V04_07950, partial [Chloroflexi bacterium]|nr:hypothetical protein [Chloroflexota bacterium]
MSLFIAACACLMLAAPASASAATPPPISWSRIYNGPADGHDLNTRVAVDAAGNVFVAGRSPTIPGDYTDANNDIAVVKYSPTGQRLWVRRWNGVGDGVDEVQDIGVDSKGNVIIAGHTWTGLDTDGPDAVDDDPNDADYITLKYAPDGRLKWARSYNGPIDRDDFAFAMAIGPGNRIFVTGYSWWAQEFGVTPIRAGIATIAYSPNGTRLWVERRDRGEGDGARDIAVGPDGNLYLTGSTMVYDGGTSQDVVTISYTPDGAERWTAAWDSEIAPLSDEDQGDELAFDGAGNLYVMGRVWTRERPEVLLLKYSMSDGALRWDTSWRHSTEDAMGLALAVDTSGNAYVAGEEYGNDETAHGNIDSFLTKFTPGGSVAWSHIYASPYDRGFDGDDQMVLDATGNAYVAISSQLTTGYDIAVLKYRPDGTLTWTQRYDRSRNDLLWDRHTSWSGRSMTLGADGFLYVS